MYIFQKQFFGFKNSFRRNVLSKLIPGQKFGNGLHGDRLKVLAISGSADLAVKEDHPKKES